MCLQRKPDRLQRGVPGPELECKELRRLRVSLPGRAGLYKWAVRTILHGRQDGLWCGLRRPDFRPQKLRGVRDCLSQRAGLYWRAVQCELHQQSQVLQRVLPGPYRGFEQLRVLWYYVPVGHDVPEWNMHISNYGSSRANMDGALDNADFWSQ